VTQAAPNIAAPSAPAAPAQPVTAARSSRPLPHSLDAEMAVLGGILLHPPSFVDVIGVAASQDFYHPAHAAIFDAMVALDAGGGRIDAICVAERMRADDTFHKLRAINGESYFAELTSAVVTIENIEWHARVVASKARRRRLIETSQAITARGYGESVDDEEFLEDAERAVLACTAMPSRTGGKDLCELVGPAMKAIERRSDRPDEIIGVSTGSRDLDEAILGWEAGALSIVAGRPSMGKTALVVNSLIDAASSGIPALFFSAEMRNLALVERLLADRARLNNQALRSGRLDPSGWGRLSRAAGELHGMPLRIDDTAGPTLGHIRSEARRWWGWVCRRWEQLRKQQPEIAGDAPRGLFSVDYLGLVNSQKDRNETDSHAIGKVTKAIRAIGKEFGIPSIALAQLSRKCEERADKRPMMSDLRDSGEIEQDADLVVFIYRDEVYNKGSRDRGVAEIIIGKQRNGPLTTVRMGFDGTRTRFYDLQGDKPAHPVGAPPAPDEDDDR